MNDATRLTLKDARILARQLPKGFVAQEPDGFARVDLVIDAGRFAAITPAGAAPTTEGPSQDLDGRIVLPPFVDVHTHLDKAHIWMRTRNPTGDFQGALQAVGQDREAHWTAKDVARRMEFCLQTAYAHGTSAIRTHIDSLGKQVAISWPVIAEARARWQGKLDLQAVPLFPIDSALDPAFMAEIERTLDAYGTQALGAVTYMVPALQAGLDAVFALAERKGWELDFHVDESADPNARSLEVIAETALRRGFKGRILVGHCCSLSRQDEAQKARVIDLVSRAGISVVSLPMCNMFLQDRAPGRTPYWRGVTAWQELRAAGVQTMIASDNVRDPFFAYGDLDMLEVWREGVRILHLDYPFETGLDAVTVAPARAMGLAPPGFAVGAPADLIALPAWDFTQALSRPHHDRMILRNGARLTESPPPYADLEKALI